MIRQAFFDRKRQNVPPIRDVKVHLIVGPPGSGKSYHYYTLCKQHGEDAVYLVSDYQNGGMDHYAAEPILFLDEFKGQISYALFLALTDRYKIQVHARYVNGMGIDGRKCISLLPCPQKSLYNLMVLPNDERPTLLSK